MALSATEIRSYLADSAITGDLAVLGAGDLQYSDAEIAAAMRACAREYNSVLPMAETVTAGCLPDDTNLFLDGIVQQLLLIELQKETREDMDYTAGGVTANLAAKRIAHIQTLLKLFGERFLMRASERKRTINLRRAYGPVG